MGMAGDSYNFCEDCLAGMTADQFWQSFFWRHSLFYPPQLTEESQKVFDAGGDFGDVVYGWSEDSPSRMISVTRSKLSFAEKERRKMTNSLRYKTMRKDGFSCKLCGVNSETDRLVIDHIIPIAKGGKTELENLRTLCQRCNSGKGTKLDQETKRCQDSSN